MNEPRRRIADLSQPVNPTQSEIDRFFAKVNKGAVFECWTWTAATNEHGYGRFGFRSDVIKAPRFSWVLHNGPIPRGMHVLHHCDNPKCVNPDHLWIGDARDNSDDKISKGRQARGATHKSVTRPETVLRGEYHPLSKLSEDEVRQIRLRLLNGEKVTALAREYKVWHGAISLIRLRKRWGHIT